MSRGRFTAERTESAEKNYGIGEGRKWFTTAEKRKELGYAICNESLYRKFYIDYWL